MRAKSPHAVHGVRLRRRSVDRDRQVFQPGLHDPFGVSRLEDRQVAGHRDPDPFLRRVRDHTVNPRKEKRLAPSVQEDLKTIRPQFIDDLAKQPSSIAPRRVVPRRQADLPHSGSGSRVAERTSQIALVRRVDLQYVRITPNHLTADQPIELDANEIAQPSNGQMTEEGPQEIEKPSRLPTIPKRNANPDTAIFIDRLPKA